MNIVRILSQITVSPDDLQIPTGELTGDGQSAVSKVLEITFGALGAVAFLIIVLAGLQFILSRGNAEKAAKARNTIIYAAVGLIIASLAFVIVRFIVNRVGA